MEYYLAVYSSVTLANRIKKNIPWDGDYIGVIYAPRSLTKGGCSHALRFKKAKLFTVRQLSQEMGIKIRGLYKETTVEGKKEYQEIQ
ncbi:MAG: putative Se/S carrier-like protein [Clostridia bacterium]